MHVGIHQTRRDAVPRSQDVFADEPFQRELLPSLLRLGEKPELLGKVAQCLHHIPRRIAPRTTRTARHALPAVPDGLAAQERLDGLVVLRLHGTDNLPRIIIVKFGRRTYRSTHPAVHACLHPFVHAHVLHEHIVIFPHKSGNDFPAGPQRTAQPISDDKITPVTTIPKQR